MQRPAMEGMRTPNGLGVAARYARVGVSAAVLTVAVVLPTSAQNPEEFFAGKTITMINGFPAGGPAQAAVDLFFKYFPRHVPGNPTVVTENMPGAGTLRAANYLFNAAPKDGTVMGLVSANALLAPLWRMPGAEYDSREVNWLGSPQKRPTAIAFFRTDAPAGTFEEAQQVEMAVGSTGAGAVTAVYTRLLNAMAGTRFRLVLGYEGNPRIMLAIEQGEVHGLLGYSWGSLKARNANLLDDDIVRVLAQLSVVPDVELTAMGVPMALDFVDDPDQREILTYIFGLEEMSRPYSVPPGVPGDRVAALRQALVDTYNDSEFQAEWVATQADPLALTTGEAMTQFILDAYSLPEERIVETSALIRGE